MAKDLWVSRQISGFDSRKGKEFPFLQHVRTDTGTHKVLHQSSSEVFLSA